MIDLQLCIYQNSKQRYMYWRIAWLVIYFVEKICTSVVASNIRLTYGNKGNIQVKDGSRWRFVKGKNMDKTGQKMLCEHLGFDDSDTAVGSSYLRKRCNVATGDFICYKTESRRISCCVHLKPHINEERISIPYVACKSVSIYSYFDTIRTP